MAEPTDDELDEYDSWPCDHEDYEVDILEWRARCWRCGESWPVSINQVERQIEHERAYAEYEERENRMQWWRDLRDRLLAPFRRWTARRAAPDLDDDVPF